MNNQKLSKMDSIKASIERLKRDQEKQQTIMSNPEYITWLESFTSKYPSFSDETWLYCPDELSKQDREQIANLQFLYSGIEEYAKKHNIERNVCCFGGFYNIKYHHVGYEIGQLCGQGTIDFCKRVSLEEEVNDDKYIDFEDIIQSQSKHPNTTSNQNKTSSNSKNETVLFYRQGKKYYYKYHGQTSELNSITINKLKEKLPLPFKVKFYGLSRAQTGKIVGDLLQSMMHVELKKVSTSNSQALQYEATFTKKEQLVSVYKVPNISALYTRSNNCNPFIYTEVNGQKVLMEVTKDYAKNNPNDYYFLGSELTNEECTFFEILEQDLVCDYIYKLSETNNKVKRKIKK